MLVLLTPLFFFLPVRQYGASRYWLIPVVAELLALALLSWKRHDLVTTSPWRFLIHAADITFVFLVFIVTTRPETGTAIAYSTVVVVGTFQLQTYGPAITSSALSGVWYGLVVGTLSGVLYPLSLWVAGRSVSALFNPYLIASTLSRAAIYIIAGVFFGVMRDFVIYNRTLERRAYEILHARGLSSIDWMSQDLLTLAARGNAALLLRATTGALDDDLAGIAENLLEALSGLRRIGAGLPAGMRSVIQICRDVVTNQLHPLFRENAQPVVLEIAPEHAERVETLLLRSEDAVVLDKLVRQAITNCRLHADDGPVTVKIVLGPDWYSIDVQDCGPKQRRGSRSRSYVPGIGHGDALEDTSSRGWRFEFLKGRGPGEPSCHRFVIPLGDKLRSV
ncbi:MAG: hypothetical protein ACRDQZ_23460 [Mycobacteriales bacterium]